MSTDTDKKDEGPPPSPTKVAFSPEANELDGDTFITTPTKTDSDSARLLKTRLSRSSTSSSTVAEKFDNAEAKRRRNMGIFLLCFGCNPCCGIPAIVYAVKAMTMAKKGELEDAEYKSVMSQKWALAGFILSCLVAMCFICYLIMVSFIKCFQPPGYY